MYAFSLSMYEIYNEQIRDLLDSSKTMTPTKENSFGDYKKDASLTRASPNR